MAELKGEVKKKIEELGVFVLLIPTRRSKHTGLFWFDWITSVVDKFQEANFNGVPYKDGLLPFIAVEFGLGVEGTPANDERIDSDEIAISYYLPQGLAGKVKRVLSSHFKKRFEWSGKSEDKMFVRLLPRNN